MFKNSDIRSVSTSRSSFYAKYPKAILYQLISLNSTFSMKMVHLGETYAQAELWRSTYRGVKWSTIRSISPLLWEIRICEYCILATEFSNKDNTWIYMDITACPCVGQVVCRFVGIANSRIPAVPECRQTPKENIWFLKDSKWHSHCFQQYHQIEKDLDHL